MDVENLEKPYLFVCFPRKTIQIQLFGALDIGWSNDLQVAVITKVSRNAEGSKCFVLRCERGGVDFVEATQLRNVQLAGANRGWEMSSRSSVLWRGLYDYIPSG